MEGPVMDNEDRKFFEQHYRAIAERLAEKGLYRNNWRYDVERPDGGVIIYKLTVTSYIRSPRPFPENAGRRSPVKGGADGKL